MQNMYQKNDKYKKRIENQKRNKQPILPRRSPATTADYSQESGNAETVKRSSESTSIQQDGKTTYRLFMNYGKTTKNTQLSTCYIKGRHTTSPSSRN
eukprot:2556994-Amphidinium_carterae.1